MISENLETFLGIPVVNYTAGLSPKSGSEAVYRFSFNYDDEEPAEALLEEFLAQPESATARGLIIGCFGESDHAPDLFAQHLIENQDKLAELRGLFIGEMTSEENEISWIQQCDLTPLLDAFPKLEEFHVRGGNGLVFQPLVHDSLKKLVFESGGLPAAVLRNVYQCEFPALEHLEFYLGTDEYGWDGTVADAHPYLEKLPFPRLKYLGLRDSEIVDEIAGLLAASPVLAQLEVLDLSLGTLTDAGAEAILAAEPSLRHLRLLNLDHHFLSDKAMQKLRASGLKASLEDANDSEDDYRYVAVAE